MSSEKLSSEEVPKRFTEWLLKMGCPAETVPSLEKITQMCRGQYYLVWRSLIEHVHPKDTIHKKRLNVFCDDIKICQQKKAYGNHNVNVVIPEQLELWNQQTEVRKKVGEAEDRVQECRISVKELVDKASLKLIQRNTARSNMEDVQRRIWLLRKVSDGLVKKKKDLEEVKRMSKSMCLDNGTSDVQNQLDECLSFINKGLNSSAGEPDQAAKAEIQMSQLSACGDILWPLLLEKRAAAAAQLKAANDNFAAVTSHRTCPYYVIALTSSLQSMLGLEVMKNQEYIKRTQNKILSLLDEMNHTLTSESCEYLVLQCEIAHMKARMQMLKSIAEDIVQHKGAFTTERYELEDPAVTMNKIRNLDNAIMSKREELCNMIKGLARIENKIYHIKDCIQIVINAFTNRGTSEFILCRGIELDLPEESISSLCQFYHDRRARLESKANISMDLDVSDVSCNGVTDTSEFTFVDELKMYMKKFALEKNRKLVLDSGEKIWTFETIDSSLSRIQSYWLEKNVPVVLSPHVRISRNLIRLVESVVEKEALKLFVKKTGNDEKYMIDIDTTSIIEEEAKITDSVKKREGNNINTLQKINKTLDLIAFNLQFWANNEAKKCISSNRTVDGKSFKEYEALYLENIIGTSSMIERMERSL